MYRRGRRLIIKKGYRFFRGKGRVKEKYRVNERIYAPEVRVIGLDGAQLGVMKTREALNIAFEQGFDLVEIAPGATPPVCKIMDYGRFKYEEKKKKKSQRKPTGEIKEISFRPSIDQHDLETKLKKVREFLNQSMKVKLSVFYKGREIVHPEAGRKLLGEVLNDLSDISVVETQPKMEGRRLSVLIRPSGDIKKKE